MVVTIGEGRFVKDPELTKTDTTVYCKFSLADNEVRKRKDGEKVETTNFFDFIIWDAAAETIVKYCKKGTQIMYQATPRQDRWEKDGQVRSRVIFRIDSFKFLGKKTDNE